MSLSRTFILPVDFCSKGQPISRDIRDILVVKNQVASFDDRNRSIRVFRQSVGYGQAGCPATYNDKIENPNTVCFDIGSRRIRRGLAANDVRTVACLSTGGG